MLIKSIDVAGIPGKALSFVYVVSLACMITRSSHSCPSYVDEVQDNLLVDSLGIDFPRR